MKIQPAGIVGVAVVGLLMSFEFANAAGVFLVPSATSVSPGESITLGVVVDAVDPTDDLIAFGFNIDDDGFVVTDVVVSPPFFDDSVAFPSTDVAASTFPGPVTGTDIPLATIALDAPLTTGSYTPGVFTDPLELGASQGLILLFGGDLEIAATTSIEVVPVPPAVWLFGSALALLTGVRRRLKTA